MERVTDSDGIFHGGAVDHHGVPQGNSWHRMEHPVLPRDLKSFDRGSIVGIMPEAYTGVGEVNDNRRTRIFRDPDIEIIPCLMPYSRSDFGPGRESDDIRMGELVSEPCLDPVDILKSKGSELVSNLFFPCRMYTPLVSQSLGDSDPGIGDYVKRRQLILNEISSAGAFRITIAVRCDQSEIERKLVVGIAPISSEQPWYQTKPRME